MALRHTGVRKDCERKSLVFVGLLFFLVLGFAMNQIVDRSSAMSKTAFPSSAIIIRAPSQSLAARWYA